MGINHDFRWEDARNPLELLAIIVVSFVWTTFMIAFAIILFVLISVQFICEYIINKLR